MIKLDIEMENSNELSLPREKCMKCQEENGILMSSHSYSRVGLCDHKICQSCFRNYHAGQSALMLELKCPCCCSLFYNDFQSIEEAILVGEAVTITTHIRPLLLQSRSAETSAQDIKCVNEIYKFAIKKS